jgi:putative oxidoreductase
MNMQNLAALAGRVLIAVIFLMSGLDKIIHYSGTLGYMVKAGLPFTEGLLVASILVEIGCGLALVAGWKTRWAAALLFLWMIPVTAVFHNPLGAGAAVQEQMVHLMKNLAIMGGMLLLVAFGPGAWSADRLAT